MRGGEARLIELQVAQVAEGNWVRGRTSGSCRILGLDARLQTRFQARSLPPGLPVLRHRSGTRPAADARRGRVANPVSLRTLRRLHKPTGHANVAGGSCRGRGRREGLSGGAAATSPGGGRCEWTPKLTTYRVLVANQDRDSTYIDPKKTPTKKSEMARRYSLLGTTGTGGHGGASTVLKRPCLLAILDFLSGVFLGSIYVLPRF